MIVYRGPQRYRIANNRSPNLPETSQRTVYRRCLRDMSVFYQRASRLFADLDLARGDGSYPKLLAKNAKVDLLVIDDFGPEVLAPEHRRDLLEIVDDRCGRGSLLITSQVPINRWHEVIGDPTLGDAILDRFVHSAHRIDLDGESIRKLRAQDKAA